MLRSVQEIARFGDVIFHVTNVSMSKNSNFDTSNNDAGNNHAKFIGSTSQSFRVTAFVQGRKAEAKKDSLLELVSTHKINADDAAKILVLPGIVKCPAILQTISITHKHESKDFYGLSLTFIRHDTKKSLENPETEQKLKGTLGKAKAKIDDYVKKLSATIAQKPLHSIKHIATNFDQILQGMERVQDFLENPLQGKIGTVINDAAQLSGRVRALSRPVKKWDPRSLATILGSLSFKRQDNGRISSAEENQLEEQLQTFTKAVFVTEICDAILQDDWYGDEQAREELRRTLTNLTTELQKRFS